MRWTWIVVVAIALPLASAAHARAQELTVAAASDLQSALPDIVSRFETATGRHVRVTFGSSGNFAAQIQNGAPFDLFFSADITYPQQLEKSGLAEPGTLRLYAIGRIVLWVNKSSSLDLNRGLQVLLDSSVRRIAIANPAHAPYGRAAVDAMQHAGLYDTVRTKLVLGENISQAAQFVQSGNADVGIVALSIAASPAMADAGRFVAVSPSSYTPIQQAAVVLKNGKNPQAAREFLEFFTKPEATAVLQRFGFELPPSIRPPLH